MKYQNLFLKMLGTTGYFPISRTILKDFGYETAVFFALIHDKFKYYLKHNKTVKHDDKDFFFIYHQEIEHELKMTYKIQMKCLKILEKIGFIETVYKDMPRKKYYTINFENLMEYFDKEEFIKLEKQKKSEAAYFTTGQVNTLPQGNYILDHRADKGNVYIYNNKNKINKNKEIYKESFDYEKIFNEYINLKIKNHRKSYALNKAIKNAIDKAKTLYKLKTDDCITLLRRHKKVVDMTACNKSYAVRSRDIESFFGQKVFQSTALLCSEYLEGGSKYEKYLTENQDYTKMKKCIYGVNNEKCKNGYIYEQQTGNRYFCNECGNYKQQN